MKTLIHMLLLSITIFALLIACDPQATNWKALYAERLGQPVAELGDTYLGQAFTDPVESGSLTRVAWATFQDGLTLLNVEKSCS